MISLSHYITLSVIHSRALFEAAVGKAILWSLYNWPKMARTDQNVLHLELSVPVAIYLLPVLPKFGHAQTAKFGVVTVRFP